MGFGAGVLMSAVSFELVEEAVDTEGGLGNTALGFFTGAVIFFAGDVAIARMGNQRGDASSPAAGQGSAGAADRARHRARRRARVGGARADAAAERHRWRAPSWRPSSSPTCRRPSPPRPTWSRRGWSKARCSRLWVAIIVVSGLASAAGYGVFDEASPGAVAFTFAFAGGAILAMLSTSMVPEAYERSGRVVGLMVTFGFAVAYGLHWWDGQAG